MSSLVGASPASLRPATIITGASSGIGREIARLAAATDEVLLVARDGAALQSLAAELAAGGGRAHWLACDLTAPEAEAMLGAALAERGLWCRRLVNNAGIGQTGLAAKLPAAAQLATIDLNIRVLAALSLAFLPAMLARGEGGILNVASVAGHLPGPRMAAYYASKAFVVSFSDALWSEARGAGVTVSCLCPGPVETAFIARATGREPGFQLPRSPFHVAARDVARQGWEGFLAGRRSIVPGKLNRFVLLAARFVPRRLLIAMMDRFQATRPSAAP